LLEVDRDYLDFGNFAIFRFDVGFDLRCSESLCINEQVSLFRSTNDVIQDIFLFYEYFDNKITSYTKECRNMTEKELFNEIIKTCANPEIERDIEIRSRLLRLSRQLENGTNYKLVCVRLSNYISFYLASHWLRAPQALLDLARTISDDADNYRGATSDSVWVDGILG